MRRLWLPRFVLLSSIPLLSLLTVSCQTADYGEPAKSSGPDFDALETRIEQYRDVQQAALEQFQAMEQQLAQWSSPGTTDLQALVTATTQQDNASIEAAVEVSSAITSIDEAAGSVFREWQIAVDLDSDAQLKADAQARLGATWQRYADMLQALRQSEARTTGVLAAINSNEQYFKDNPGASEIANRQPQLNELRNDVQALVYSMNNALDSTKAFLSSIASTPDPMP